VSSQQPLQEHDRWLARHFFFWVFLCCGIALTGIVVRLAPPPSGELPPPDSDSPGPVEVYVHLVEASHLVAARCEKLAEKQGTPSPLSVASLRGEVGAQKTRLRVLDLTGVADPIYADALRTSRQAMVISWQRLEQVLEKAMEDRTGGHPVDIGGELKSGVSDVRDPLRVAANVLGISVGDFEDAASGYVQKGLGGAVQPSGAKSDEVQKLCAEFKTIVSSSATGTGE